MSFRRRGRRTQQDWEAMAQKQIDDTQVCTAYDIAQKGLQYFPQSLKLKQISARALARTGAFEQARTILEDLCSPHRPDEETLHRLGQAMRQVVASVSSDPQSQPSGHELEALSAFLVDLGRAAGTRQPVTADEETVSLLARVYKDLWKDTGDASFGVLSRETYLRAFRESLSHYPGVNAATMSWLTGQREQAQELARRALGSAEGFGEHGRLDDYWALVTKGEALLLLGRDDEARDCYAKAVSLPDVKHGEIVSSLQQLLLLQDNGFTVPAAVLGLLRPPTVVMFVGHRIDEPGRRPPRFPPALEGTVRNALDSCLEKIDARIAYCSAANGSDILFIEAMRDRDAEVNIVLPFHHDDFIKVSVDRADGRRWVSRFHHALHSAATVKYATSERHLDTEELFAFGSDVMRGFTELRAASLETQPCLVALFDGKDSGLPGGTSDVVRRWGTSGRLIRIPLAAKGRSASPRAPKAPAEPSPRMTQLGSRAVQCMLFADVKGYSSLADEEIPRFIDEFLGVIATKLKRQTLGSRSRFVNTWGDAIFAVMKDPVALMNYAVALQSIVTDTNWTAKGFPTPLALRIALHAGPAFTGKDPFTSRRNFYGANVNRTARLEPVTLPGKIYASEQFVACLVSRLCESGKVARTPGRAMRLPYHCEYVGNIELAKGFGEQPAYHLRTVKPALPARRPA
jgi:class 3 adenylate cyclase/tetratricopeptide (TPR) repeat protein